MQNQYSIDDKNGPEFDKILLTRESQSVSKQKEYNVKFLFLFLLTISIGMFQFGYMLTSWNALANVYRARLCYNKNQQWHNSYLSLFTSVQIMGAMITSLSSGLLLKNGKKKLLLFTNFILCFGNSLTQVDIWQVQLIGRFFWGMAAGVYTALVPKFINETAPMELQGPFGAFSQLMITTGILIVSLLVLRIPYFTFSCENGCDLIWVTQHQINTSFLTQQIQFYEIFNSYSVQIYWRIVIGIPSILAVLQSILILTVFNYDTPYELKKADQNDKLYELMQKIYIKEAVQDRIDDIDVREVIGVELQTQIYKPTYKETFFDPALRRASWIGVTTQAFQQLTGINSIIFYSTFIFDSSQETPQFPIPNQSTAMINTFNFLGALAAIPLLKYFGRRPLLIITFFGCTVFLVVNAYVQTVSGKLTATILFIILFELGPGPICWLYMSEIMNEKGVAVGTFINWSFTFLTGLITPILFNYLGQKTFLIFSCTCCIGFLFVCIFIKETKGLNQTSLINLYRTEKYKLSSLRDTNTTSCRSSFLSENEKSDQISVSYVNNDSGEIPEFGRKSQVSSKEIESKDLQMQIY